MNKYRKFFAALVPALAVVLDSAGVELPAGWTEGLVAVVTPILVWALPNA